MVLDGLVFSFDRMTHVCLRRRDIALYVKGETGTDVAFHERKTGQMRDLFVLGAVALGLDRAFRLRLERVTVQELYAEGGACGSPDGDDGHRSYNASWPLVDTGDQEAPGTNALRACAF